jgi:hypothetical protein
MADRTREMVGDEERAAGITSTKICPNSRSGSSWAMRSGMTAPSVVRAAEAMEVARAKTVARDL